MKRKKPLSPYFKRFAKLGFLFFLIKGLLWLTVSIVIGALLSDE